MHSGKSQHGSVSGWYPEILYYIILLFCCCSDTLIPLKHSQEGEGEEERKMEIVLVLQWQYISLSRSHVLSDADITALFGL